MDPTKTAGGRLAAGDRARDLLRAGVLVGDIAQQMGVSQASVRKSVWLSEAFPPEERAGIGDCLCEVGPSHLEAVAAVRDRGLRAALITAAAVEHLPVRELRQRVAGIESTATVGWTATQAVSYGGPEALSRAQHAVERYTRFTDAQLDRLLAGPAGPVVHDLTRAAQSLAERLAAHTASQTPHPPLGG
jgi:hypothetical protein